MESQIKPMSLAELRAKLAGAASIPKPAPKAEPLIEVAEPSEELPEEIEEQPAKQVEQPAITSHEAINREAWLGKALGMLSNSLAKVMHCKLSVGYGPNRRGTKRLQAHSIPAHETADKIPQVFISPVAQTSHEALTLLVSELAHLVDPVRANGIRLIYGLVRNELKNERDFEWTAKPALAKIFDSIIASIGEYPHAGIIVGEYKAREMQPKLECLESGYKLRMARMWLDKHGPPICPCHKQPMTEVK